MYLDISDDGRVYLRRDVSKYHATHLENQPQHIAFNNAQSTREHRDAERLIEMLRVIFTTKGVAA